MAIVVEIKEKVILNDIVYRVEKGIYMMKLLRKYNYLIIIIVFTVILCMSYNSYKRTKEIIKCKYKAQSHLVENSVTHALESANGAYSISENILNEEMEKYSKILLKEYKSNPQIETWNVDEIKKQMDNYDIYIIDRNLKVIKTTFEKDLGMDFSKYPSFSKLLKSRLEANCFTADKMDISSNTGEIKKYSYMPTSDQKYLIELSINILDRYPVLKELNAFSLARNLVDKYPYVEDISFYKFNKQANNVGMIKDKKNPIDINIPKNDKALVKEAVLWNTIQSRVVKHSNFTTTIKYIPILTKNQEGENDWWNSFAIGIAYSNKEMLREINKETNMFFIHIFTIATVFIIFITSIIYLLKKTEYMAYHDHLTGLANRKAFEEYFNEIINKRKSKSKVAILYLDLDDFKYINDHYGHEMGDKLLIEVAMRLKNIVRDQDKVSRVGGDEFIILLTDIQSENHVSRVREKLENSIKRPFYLDGRRIMIHCSIGLSISSDKDFSLEGLINKADVSMYSVKNEKGTPS
ncbi:GGDEF domain-containing protein [Crassaminicella profunda]|uniref:GGDEF domain-containing protein n=1 Tax=Crassaminicella profunda TaxID=1286698 RepID=UPI001CA76BDA|nr:GGDEF domain-containing protein [Crassaminicella profunda]QZY56131.1 GGDEF domain-containing protein [Crassaminicella profunda]